MGTNKCNKVDIDNLAIFDLDGTLYYSNSHIEFLNYKYKYKVFNSKVMKLFGVITPKIYLRILFWFYDRALSESTNEFILEFRKSAIQLLKRKKEEGYKIVIISNAPKELIEAAAKSLDVDWLKAEIGEKDKILLNNYKYKNLYVCTDNISDMNLLDIADSKTIYITNKTQKRFIERYPDAQILEG